MLSGVALTVPDASGDGARNCKVAPPALSLVPSGFVRSTRLNATLLSPAASVSVNEPFALSAVTVSPRTTAKSDGFAPVSVNVTARAESLGASTANVYDCCEPAGNVAGSRLLKLVP